MKRSVGIFCALLVAAALGSPSSALSEGAEPQSVDIPLIQEAPIALLVDATSGQTLYSRNADRRFIPASITKVMSAYVAFELIDAGKLSVTQDFTMSEKAGAEWHRKGSTMFLKAGDKVSVDDLLRGITSVSANDASIVLAEGALGSVANWTDQMNETAKRLNMHDSHFTTPNGWPDGGKTFTTAHDLQLLAQAVISRHPEKYRRYFGKDGLRYNGYAQANHDPITGKVKGADGIKTGFTNQAGNGFLGSAARDGTRLIMVIAAIEQDSTRAEIARGLMNWGFDGFTRKTWFAPETAIGRAQVQNGNHQSIGLVTTGPIIVAAQQNSRPSFRIVYDGPLEAPIAKGEIVAELEIAVNGLPKARVPLAAATDVEQANFFQRITNAFGRWFS